MKGSGRIGGLADVGLWKGQWRVREKWLDAATRSTGGISDRRDTARVERGFEDGSLAPLLVVGVDAAMTLTEGESEYAQGVGHFTDFLHNHSILSWGPAINSLQAAVHSRELDPDRVADALHKLGLLSMFDSDYRSALYYFETCLQSHRTANVHVTIGAVYLALHEYERGAWHYRQALDLGGEKGLGYMGLGRALLETRRVEEAIDCFTKSASSTETSDAFLWTGNAYRRAGVTVKAIEAYEAGLALNEEDPDICQALAEFWLEDQADPATALERFDRMYELPESTQATSLCRTRTPFAAYFCERYPQGPSRIPAFEALCGLRRAVVDVKEKLRRDRKGSAIHYTSLDTARALVVGRSPLRAHRADNMNDPSEGEVLRKMIGLDLASEFLDFDGAEDVPSAYIASFVLRPEDDPFGTPADDNLLHWRLYGKSDGIEGGGACLAYPCRLFRPNSDTHESAPLYHADGLLAAPSVMRQLTRWQAVPPRLYSVAYEGGGGEELVAGIRPHMQRMVELKRAIATDGEKSVLSNCVKVLLEEIRFLFKSRNYDYEKEARVAVMVWPDERGLETCPTSEKEYVEFGRDVYPTELVLGPGVTGNPLPEAETMQPAVTVRKSGVLFTPR